MDHPSPEHRASGRYVAIFTGGVLRYVDVVGFSPEQIVFPIYGRTGRFISGIFLSLSPRQTITRTYMLAGRYLAAFCSITVDRFDEKTPGIGLKQSRKRLVEEISRRDFPGVPSSQFLSRSPLGGGRPRAFRSVYIVGILELHRYRCGT